MPLKSKDIALNIYSFGYSAGFIRDARLDEIGKYRIDLNSFPEMARQLGLNGIEFPFDYFFNIERMDDGIQFIKETQQKGFRVFIDLESFDFEYVCQLLPKIRNIRINKIRIKMNHLGPVFYGGNRYSSSSFADSRYALKEELHQIFPYLKDYGVKLLIENHQDLSSIDIREIVESVSPEHVGVNWDVGNSFSACDTVESFWKNVGMYVENVHLKDYAIIKTINGIKLLRTSLGAGVVDFKKVFSLMDSAKQNITASIELGAQKTRECDIDHKNYFSSYHILPTEKVVFLDHLIKNTSHNCSGNTAYEDGASPLVVASKEWEEVRESVQYLEGIL